jgi:signal transduction histidine kinase
MLAGFRRRQAGAYAFGIFGVMVATAARYSIDPLVGDHVSFSFYYLAVSLAAWLGGFWPVVPTAILGALAGNLFFTHPAGSLWISTAEELLGMSIFVAVSLIIGALSETSIRRLERAQLAEREKDEFMATVAHELRSPLSVIHYANAIDRTSANQSARDHIDLIDRQVQHLNRMVQDLLDISRATRGLIDLDCKQMDAAAIVNEAVEKVKPLIDARSHVLAIDMATEPLLLHADPLRIQQVLTNLLNNAAKYTPDGGNICLRIRRIGDNVVFSVRDNGQGIAEDALPRIFDMFVQLPAAGHSRDDGLGIGLALVRKLVEMHGGSVSARSAGPNRGSEFTVTLPLLSPASNRPVAARKAPTGGARSC